MADRYDGSVRIKTDADTTPAEKQLKKLKNSIRKPATGQSWQRQNHLPRRLNVSDLLL